MKGNAGVIDVLNSILTAELTAINQYFIHYKMCQNWGYPQLAKKKREESIEEMKHADKVIERILFLDGVPNMQRLSPVSVGEDPIEQHKLDLALEMAAYKRLNDAIALCVSASDNGTRGAISLAPAFRPVISIAPSTVAIKRTARTWLKPGANKIAPRL